MPKLRVCALHRGLEDILISERESCTEKVQEKIAESGKTMCDACKGQKPKDDAG